VADASVERERLAELVEELRDKVHVHETLWRRLGEHTSALHAPATQGREA
jgi:hypothetical protein